MGCELKCNYYNLDPNVKTLDAHKLIVKLWRHKALVILVNIGSFSTQYAKEDLGPVSI